MSKQFIPHEFKTEAVRLCATVSGKEAKAKVLEQLCTKFGMAMPGYWASYPDSPLHSWKKDVKIGPSVRSMAATHSIDLSKINDGYVTVDGVLYMSREMVAEMQATAKKPGKAAAE